jgi:hypothetical protein
MPNPVPKELLLNEEWIGFAKFPDKQTMRRASSAKILKPADHRKPEPRD